mmetsp:Transcript_27919/g.48435  ORF Transcript_27919/g.48435 Transcript_27919/m.48435 type:complete len:274 (-) Transcript_27919:833-1654(-)
MDGPELGREAGGGLQVVPVHRPAVADRVGDGFPLIKRVIRVTIHQLHPHLLQHCAQSLLVPHVRFELRAVADVLAGQHPVPVGVLVEPKVEPLVVVHRRPVPAEGVQRVPDLLALQHAARHDVHRPVRRVGGQREPAAQVRLRLQLRQCRAGGGPVRVHCWIRPAELGRAHHHGVRVVAPGRAQGAVAVVGQALQQDVLGVHIVHGGDAQARPPAVRDVVIHVRRTEVLGREERAVGEAPETLPRLLEELHVLDVVPVGQGEGGVDGLKTLLK